MSKYGAPPPLSIDVSADYRATLHTNAGDISLKLFADEAPMTVNNFVFLAQDGFYDSVIFHRVVPGFVIQGGDPTGTGTGGPGYNFGDELEKQRGYDRGILAMANSGANTNGSQFFICLDDVGLPHSYSIFGEVTDGMEVVDSIAAGSIGPGDRPHDPVAINSVTITKR